MLLLINNVFLKELYIDFFFKEGELLIKQLEKYEILQGLHSFNFLVKLQKISPEGVP